MTGKMMHLQEFRGDFNWG